MARKKSPSTASPRSADTPAHAQRPRVLGWLVLAAGTFSTWYWYRPLPPSAIESAHGTPSLHWSPSELGPKSIWNERGLILPSLDAPAEVAATHPNPSLAPIETQLVGPENVTLVPARDWKKEDLGTIVKSEQQIPMVPIPSQFPLSKSQTKPPAAWTPDEMQLTSQSNFTNPNRSILRGNPIASGSVHEGNTTPGHLPESQWPDRSFHPNESKSELQQARAKPNFIPPLLEAGMKSIRTQEDREPNSTISAPSALLPTTGGSAGFPPPPEWKGSGTPGQATPMAFAPLPAENGNGPVREPKFIKQPVRKNR